MEAFKEAWLAIDVQGRGSITSRDLSAYMKKQNYDDAFVNKWMRLFDQDNSGTIEVEEYCDVLGLNPKQIMSEVRSRIATGSMPEGVEYISGDMDLSWQIKIANLTLEGLRTNQNMKDVPKWIKTQADRQFNQLWHVVIVNGQFWCYFGHEPAYSFIFRYGKQIFIIFRTPFT
ncbi:hypothetical protein BOX15_Mlig012489g3 [Macrostomum lignano]|uniref:Uncharacterized protein n=2 Tax=Macrostomum lignano TaxID=282301 RepID=A0A267EPZ4_9PLAT|nr:hypothetical protein BOX15_Mlig012489g2 [Macrostomum lignano]PAA71981.1 hypothetical protein BOX15_Mlig012489g1 [Macrostomum lignano]PAA78249.1 hypothetical protein BOX15_Mlig012489g3 [Macrostomum lignano]